MKMKGEKSSMKTRNAFAFGWLAVAGLAVWASAASADEFNEVKNISYYTADELSAKGDYAKNRCKVNLRHPVGVTNFATVVSIHGGGLVKGSRGYSPWPKDKKEVDPVAHVAVGYRLLTNATPADCIGDAAAAVAWTLKHIAEYGGDPKKVFVTGVSGGGYLTAMIGLDPKWLAPHGLKPTDLAGIAPLTGQMTKHFNVRKVGFKDGDAQFLPKIDEWSPLAYAAKDGVPPSCFLTGGRDVEWKVRVEENEMLASSMRALGNPSVEFHETEGDHGGGVMPSAYFLRDFVMKTVDAGGVGRFAPGERVAFFGDSITHGGRYVGYLQLFAALRHPGWNVRCLNAGISGDTATGGLDRWDWDLLAMKPDRVFTMFGMNDVGRDCWKDAQPDEKTAGRRAAALARYAASQAKLVEKLGAAGVKRVLVTPSPFDQYSDVNGNNIAFCNDPGLDSCAKTVRGLAAAHNLGLVEFHRPMTELLKTHPKLYLCGKDRVHPQKEGHLLMAALVLEAMGENPTVARVSINAKTGKVEKLAEGKSRNLKVRTLAATTKGVRFTYEPKALPLPALPEYLADDKIWPLTEKFNQETFVVAGLQDGRYDLAFDGESVGTFSAAEFASGVNVALLKTPNQLRAQAAAEIMYAIVDIEGQRRNLVCMLRSAKNAKVDIADQKAVEAYHEKRCADMEAKKVPWASWHRNTLNKCRALKWDTAGLAAKSEDLYERLNAVRPAVSRVTILPTK